jgi:hypothetical protein
MAEPHPTVGAILQTMSREDHERSVVRVVHWP